MIHPIVPVFGKPNKKPPLDQPTFGLTGSRPQGRRNRIDRLWTTRLRTTDYATVTRLPLSITSDQLLLYIKFVLPGLIAIH